MGTESGDMALYPTARLLVVIGTDGSVGLLLPRLAAARPLTVQELNLIAAFSTGQIADNEEGLASYMDAAGLNEQQREASTKLTRQLLRNAERGLRSGEVGVVRRAVGCVATDEEVTLEREV